MIYAIQFFLAFKQKQLLILCTYEYKFLKHVWEITVYFHVLADLYISKIIYDFSIKNRKKFETCI